MAPSLASSGLVGLLLSAVQVAGHGLADYLAVYPGGADAGTYYKGYNPSYQYERPPPKVVGWSVPDDLQNTFINPDKYKHPDVICHLGATPADLAVPVKGGDEVGIHWNQFPDSHKGPVLDYLANCNGPCQNVDKTKLKFFEISRSALLDAASDLWAPNVMIKNNLTWFVKIPDSIEPGNYILRHEIIGLHAAGSSNGAQNYPFCFNLAISSSGTDKPAGVLGTELYSVGMPGIQWDLFRKQTSYPIPGPQLYTGAASSARQRMPRITATGTGILSLDVAALPKTPTAVSTPKAASGAAPTAAPNAPSAVYSTLVITEKVTVTTHATRTAFTTVTRPRR